MNSEHIYATKNGLTLSRKFVKPASTYQLEILKSVFVQDGKIFCRMGSEQFLSIIDEATLALEKK